MNKVFKDLKIGDYIYEIKDLDVIELKITRIDDDDVPNSERYIEFKADVEDRVRFVYVNNYSSSHKYYPIFSDRGVAWRKLIGDSKARYDVLENKIDKLIIEFDKLEKFLENVKGKELW